MRILIADTFSESHLGAFRELGLDVDYRPSVTRDELPADEMRKPREKTGGVSGIAWVGWGQYRRGIPCAFTTYVMAPCMVPGDTRWAGSKPPVRCAGTNR